MNKWLKGISLVAILAFNAHANGNDDILISAEEAVKLIGKPNVMFAMGDNPDVYELGHIKGSVEMGAHHLHHADIVGHMHCAPLFMCPKEAEEYISSKGISNDTLVIAYDDFRGPNATGVYAYFKSFGHKKIKILDGGRSAILAVDPEQKIYDDLKEEIKANKDALKEAKKAEPKDEALITKLKSKDKELKKKLDKQEPKLLIQKGKEPELHGSYHIDLKKVDYNYIAGKDEIVHAVQDIINNGDKSQYVVIDSRGITEIIGEKKLDNVARGGHIPGSKFIEWKNITDFDKRLSFKSKEEMQKVFDKYGVTKDKTIYAYCHVGAGRSTEIITALELLGYPNIKVYTGSWDEWGNDMNLPIRR
jgi:thiosulfate/3-mercaptopyruvate sulfurtransferase